MVEPGQIEPIPIFVHLDCGLAIPMVYMGMIGFCAAMVAFGRDKLYIGLGLFNGLALTTVLLDYFHLLPWTIFP